MQGCGGSPLILLGMPINPALSLDPSGWRRVPPTAFWYPLPDPVLWQTEIHPWR